MIIASDNIESHVDYRGREIQKWLHRDRMHKLFHVGAIMTTYTVANCENLLGAAFTLTSALVVTGFLQLASIAHVAPFYCYDGADNTEKNTQRAGALADKIIAHMRNLGLKDPIKIIPENENQSKFASSAWASFRAFGFSVLYVPWRATKTAEIGDMWSLAHEMSHLRCKHGSLDWVISSFVWSAGILAVSAPLWGGNLAKLGPPFIATLMLSKTLKRSREYIADGMALSLLTAEERKVAAEEWGKLAATETRFMALRRDVNIFREHPSRTSRFHMAKFL